MKANFIFKTVVVMAAVLVSGYALSVMNLFNNIITVPVGSSTPSQYFQVTAQGTALAKPDKATITISAEAKGQTAQEAQQAMNEKINSIIAVIKAEGIKDDEFKTTNFNISPQYRYTNGDSILTGYNASTSLQVRTKDFDVLNTLVDKTVAAGADRVSNIQFIVDEQDEYLTTARKEAIEKAQDQAEKIAKEAGIHLGKLVNIDVNADRGSYPQPVFARAISLADESADYNTEVQTGTSELTVSVTLYYKLD